MCKGKADSISSAPSRAARGALSALRRQRLEAWKAERGEQPALFELRDDCRPVAEETAAGRYQEPTFQ